MSTQFVDTTGPATPIPAFGHSVVPPRVVSATMQRVNKLGKRVAQADISVLISGESGTGKEVMARFIHKHSQRCLKPFVAINCAAIPESMLEATLFGHEKGAFTGANEKRQGKFELADGGTLLLDEITEMPIALQAKLLRVLQEREVERLGSQRMRKVDVRIIATSNRELDRAVRDGQLREDLFYRLSVFPLRLPALRDRLEDALPLAQYFLDKYQTSSSFKSSRLRPLQFSKGACDAIVSHTWPGNVRELENVVQRALVLCETDEISALDLCIESVAMEEGDALQDKLRCKEEQVLLEVLKKHDGVRIRTAEDLGISERTLRYKLKQLRDRGMNF